MMYRSSIPLTGITDHNMTLIECLTSSAGSLDGTTLHGVLTRIHMHQLFQKVILTRLQYSTIISGQLFLLHGFGKVWFLIGRLVIYLRTVLLVPSISSISITEVISEFTISTRSGEQFSVRFFYKPWFQWYFYSINYRVDYSC